MPPKSKRGGGKAARARTGKTTKEFTSFAAEHSAKLNAICPQLESRMNYRMFNQPLLQIDQMDCEDLVCEFAEEMMDHYKWLIDMKSDFKQLCADELGKRAVPKTPGGKKNEFEGIADTIALFDTLGCRDDPDKENLPARRQLSFGSAASSPEPQPKQNKKKSVKKEAEEEKEEEPKKSKKSINVSSPAPQTADAVEEAVDDVADQIMDEAEQQLEVEDTPSEPTPVPALRKSTRIKQEVASPAPARVSAVPPPAAQAGEEEEEMEQEDATTEDMEEQTQQKVQDEQIKESAPVSAKRVTRQRSVKQEPPSAAASPLPVSASPVPSATPHHAAATTPARSTARTPRVVASSRRSQESKDSPAITRKTATPSRNRRIVMSDGEDDEEKEEEDKKKRAKAAASPSRARIAYNHEHVVKTPVKSEFRAAVDQVVEKQAQPVVVPEQKEIRARIPTAKAKPAAKTARLPKVAVPSGKERAAEAARQTKNDRAACVQRNKEEMMREKAERIRQAREEKERIVQLNRAEKEAAAARKKEKILQQAAAVKELQARTASPSRVAGTRSPARMASPSRIAAAVRTPGRVRMLPLAADSPRTPRPKASRVEREGVTHKVENEQSSQKSVPRRKSRKQKEKEVKMEEEEQVDESMDEEEEQREREAEERRRKHEMQLQRRREEEAERTRVLKERQEREMREREEEERERALAAHREKQRMERERQRMEAELAAKARLAEIEREEMDRERERMRVEQERMEREREEMRRRVAEAEEKARREAAEEAARLKEAAKNKLVNKHLLNTTVSSNYEMTPEKVFVAASEENYGIDDLSSGDETDDEDHPRKKVPVWASTELKRLCREQANAIRKNRVDPDAIFPPIRQPDILAIFGEKAARKFAKRTSSAIWQSPISNPSKGVSRFLD